MKYLVLCLVFFALSVATGGVGGILGFIFLVIAEKFLGKHNEQNEDD
jgi:hypothetical protein